MKSYSDQEKINVEGILVRAVGEKTDTVLFDSHPEKAFKSKNGKSGRFLDSFLGAGESLDLPAPMNIKLTVMMATRWGPSVIVTRPAELLKVKEKRKKAYEAMKARHKAQEAALLKKAEEKAKAAGKKLPVDSKGNVVVEQSPEQLVEIENELTEELGEEVAKETVKATKEVNSFRRRHNIPPIKIDVESTKKAQDYLQNYILGLSKRRHLSEDMSGCG